MVSPARVEDPRGAYMSDGLEGKLNAEAKLPVQAWQVLR